MSMDMPNKPVLLLPGHPNSSDIWYPLSEHYQLCFLYPQMDQFALSLGVENGIPLQRFVNADVHEHALNETAQLTARIVNQLEAIGQRVAAPFESGQAPAQLNGQFGEWFSGFAMHHLRERLIELAALEELASAATIAGCVVHEDVSIDTRTLVLFCRENGIPTIHVPHANCHLLTSGGPDIHRESICDWIAAAGVYMRDWYIANGYPAERIRITGAPYWDGYYEDDIPSREEARKALNLPLADRVIAYAGTWTQTTGLRGEWDKEINAGIKAVLELARNWSAQLLIKVHPNDAPQTDEAYANIMRSAGLGGLVTRAHGNYTLRAADVLIAQGPSNVCVDAAILGTPSCYLRTEGFDFAHRLPYRCEPDDLPAAAQAAMDSRGADNWQDFVTTYNAVHPNGGATENVVEMVRQICQ